MGYDNDIEEVFGRVLSANVRPALGFRVGAPGDPGPLASKLGGEPWLPEGAQWPRDRRARPLSLLAQVNCADLAPLPGFPHEGLLQLFVRGGDIEWGADASAPDDQDGFRVLYHPRVPALAEPAERSGFPAPSGSDELGFDFLPFGEGAWALEFARQAEGQPITSDDWLFNDSVAEAWMARHPGLPICREASGRDPIAWMHALDYSSDPDAAWERYGNTWDPSDPRDQVGGWPSFEQVDPRWWPGREALRRYDTVLFQLDSQHGDRRGRAEVMWGDAGVGCFLINGGDLARLDFSRVMYTWDCG